MKRTLLCFILFGLGQLAALGQTTADFRKHIENNRYIDCQDVSFNVHAILEGILSRQKLDSARLFLDYWKAKCGDKEQVISLETLLDIAQKRFTLSQVDEVFLRRMAFFRLRKQADQQNAWLGRFNPVFNTAPDLLDAFLKTDSLLVRFSWEITELNSLSNDERFISRFYAESQPTFRPLFTDYKLTRSRAVYDKVLTETLRMPDFHLAIYAGAMVPFGKLEVFGTRPTFGFLLGWKKLRNNYDFGFGLGIGASNSPYTIDYENQLIETTKWTQYELSFSYNYDFLQSSKADVMLLTGIGAEGISVLSEDNDYGNDAYSMGSLNLNLGIGLEFHQHWGYYGLQTRYNWVDYKNGNGTALNGNYLSVRLLAGFLSNYQKDRLLQGLEYQQLKNFRD